MALSPSGGIPALDGFPILKKAIEEIAALRGQEPLHLMINKLPPRTTVPIHRDWILPTRHQSKAPTVERWHLPIFTNPESKFWDQDNGAVHMTEGFWWGPLPYWRSHQIWNGGDTVRIHVVVDLDTPTPQGSYD